LRFKEITERPLREKKQLVGVRRRRTYTPHPITPGGGISSLVSINMNEVNP
jgi:hypothetical protein